MEGLFVPVALASLTTSAVLLPLLLLSARLQNRYAGRTLYVVWLVLALRLAVPVDLSLPQTPVQVTAPNYTVTWPTHQSQLPPVQTLKPSVDTPVGEAVTSTEPENSAAVSLIELAAVVWLGGVLWLLLVRGSGYLFTRRALLRFSRPADGETVAQTAALCAELSLRRPVPVRFHPGLSSPLTLGVIKPLILLPVGEAPEGALRHELCHIRRKDLLYQLLLLWVTTVHWFNPLVWWMSRVARRNLEFCCDDDVVRGRDAAFRRQYGELLLTTAAETDGPVLSTRFGGSAAEMKRRLSNLFTCKKNSAALTAVVLLGVLLVGVLVACESQSDSPAPPDGESALLNALQESITYDGQTVGFTLPEGETTWNLYIAGRMEAEGMGGMSLHYLDETDWQPGQSYSFELEPETVSALTELTMDVTAGEEERSIDLLPYLSTGTLSSDKPTLPENVPLGTEYLYDFRFSERYDARVSEAFSLLFPDTVDTGVSGNQLYLLARYQNKRTPSTEENRDGDGMVPHGYRTYRYEFGTAGTLMVETDVYEPDGLEFVSYLWTDVAGARTGAQVEVGSTEEELLSAYPENLYYLEPGMGLDSALPYDCGYAWQPFTAESNDIRDITFYLRDGAVAAIEMMEPYELRYVYGYDRDWGLERANANRT